MATAITLAGESLIARKQAAGEPLVIDTFLLALVPDINPDLPVDRTEGKPDAGQIVHTYAIPEEFKGYVNPNQVVYSMLLGSDLGNFSFNWLGLYSSTDDVVVAISHLPQMEKWKTDPATNAAGNNLTRNMLLEFSGAQAATQITVEAATWQVDFTTRLNGLDERERNSNRDIYGRACFFADAAKVTGAAGVFSLGGGTLYVEGIRVALPQTPVMAGTLPKKIWLDVGLIPQGADKTADVQILALPPEQDKADYADSMGSPRYLVPVADIAADGTVTDLRGDLGVEDIHASVIAWIGSMTPGRIGAAEATHSHKTADVTDLLAAPHQWLRGQRYPVAGLTAADGAVLWNMAEAPVAVITLTDAVTTITMTNAQPGATYELTVRQDGAGGRSVAFPASVLWPGGAALAVTPEAGAEDLVMFSVCGTPAVPVIRGFAAQDLRGVL